MSFTLMEKRKGRALPEDLGQEEPVFDVPHQPSSSASESSDSRSDSSDDTPDSDSESSSSDTDSDSDSESKDDVGPEFLEALLAKARATARAQAQQTVIPSSGGQEEDFIHLGSDDEGDGKKAPKPLPLLDTSSLPAPYITLSDSRTAGPSKLRDPDIEQAHKAASALSAPAAPAPPPSASRDGKRPTKKELKQMKHKTAGPGWFDLPAPAEADLPRLHREVEALRLHKQLDPKQFYRKEPGEGKGIKGLPKHFAIGTILPTNAPFGGASADNAPRSSRKRTLVDELVDDAEARSYAKKKFKELQSVRGARGRGTLAAKKALRKPKW